MPKRARCSLIAAALAAVALAGCAGAPNAPSARTGAVFYPPSPEAPRIQHLATYSGERDVALPDSDFAKFIVGEEGNARQLRQPYGAALFEGRLYVADSRGPGLAVFDLVQRRFTLLTGSGAGRMKRPVNVAIDRDGTKYVTDTGRDQILVFDRGERFVAAYGAAGQFRPVSCAIAGERLYVADIQHHEVQVLDKRSGRLLFKFGSAGSAPGELFHPTNIAVGEGGDLFVVETGNYRVQRFTPEGKPVRVYGEVGNTPGSFARPKGLAVDRAGRLYVGDAAFENVQLFDPGGRLLMHFGQPGSGADALNLPAGVSIDYDNVGLFRGRADPGFDIEYLILVVSQFGPNKVDVFGFGKMNGLAYPPDEKTAARAGR